MRKMNTWLLNLGLAAFVLAASIASTACTQNASSITSKRYALVYGVSIYNNDKGEGESFPITVDGVNYTSKNLTYSDNDAVDMTNLVTQQGWTVYSRVWGGNGDSTSATPPTKSQMVNDLADIATKADADSTVMIYFSGHGDVESGTSYIIPYEGIYPTTGTSALELANCVSPANLSSMLSVLPTKNIIVIFDTCYSGGFVDSGSAIDSSPSSYASMQSYSAFSTAMEKFGSLLVANASASGSKTPIVLSAAGSNEYSYDGSGNGVFTGYLLDAATNGDSDSDGYVTMTEAYAYTAKKIKSWDEANSYSVYPFLPHLSGGTRDLVLFTD